MKLPLSILPAEEIVSLNCCPDRKKGMKNTGESEFKERGMYQLPACRRNECRQVEAKCNLR